MMSYIHFSYFYSLIVKSNNILLHKSNFNDTKIKKCLYSLFHYVFLIFYWYQMKYKLINIFKTIRINFYPLDRIESEVWRNVDRFITFKIISTTLFEESQVILDKKYNPNNIKYFFIKTKIRWKIFEENNQRLIYKKDFLLLQSFRFDISAWYINERFSFKDEIYKLSLLN